MPRLALVALAIALALPTSAHAVEIGSDHPAPDDAWSCSNVGGAAGLGCVVYQEQELGNGNINVVPSAGRITGFKVSNATGPVRLRVFRSNGDPVGQSGDAPGGPGLSAYSLVPAIPVQAGDFIALELGDTSAIGVRDATAEAGTNLLEYALVGPSRTRAPTKFSCPPPSSRTPLVQ